MLSHHDMLGRLQDALDQAHNYSTVADVVERCRSGQWQWHQKGDGVVITSVTENKIGERILCGHFIFGDMDDVLSQSEEIDEYGRKAGCTKFLCDGRKGWERVLKGFGWKPVGIILEKDLINHG